MNDKIIIRELELDDYEPLVALWSAVGLPARLRGRDARAAIRRQIESPCTRYLVAEREGRLVGSVFGTHDSRKGWINRLAVDPAFRKRGIGRALVDELEAWFSGQGLGIVACLVEGWNTDSKAVFERLGYQSFEGMIYLTKRDDPDV